MKNTKMGLKISHIIMLVLGYAVFIGGCFQNSLWFDEAYSAGMTSHTLPDLIKWATFDVHPHLYYIGLKIFTLIFGNSLVAMRLFSALGAILFVTLGFTHIRKDFGEEIGFWFSFCSIFSASTLVYALQIRMYTWAVLFVTLAAIYALRSFKNQESKSYRVLFLVSSLCAAYTHYFALFSVAAINIVMLVAYIKQNKTLKVWFVNAAIQIGGYIPGALVFLTQIFQGGGTWITINYPDLVFDITSYHFLGDCIQEFFGYKTTMYLVVGGIFLALYIIGAVFLVRYYKSDKISQKTKSALKGAVAAYFGVVIFALTVSLFRIIYYIRYTVVIGGLLFFMMALLMKSIQSKVVKTIIATAMVVLFSVQGMNLYKVLYDPSSHAVKEAIDGTIDEDDDFLFEDISCYIATTQYPENRAYFYNSGKWGVHKAYRALGKESYVIDELEMLNDKGLNNRVWVLGRTACYEYLVSKGYVEKTCNRITTLYHHYDFELILMEKG